MCSASIHPDPALLADVAGRFKLRTPNRMALAKTIERLSSAKPESDDSGTVNYHQLHLDLATGVGKTYLAASLVDYVSAQGVRNILIVTPGKTIQDKTIGNFTKSTNRYVSGSVSPPLVITPDNFRVPQIAAQLQNPRVAKVFIFNVQQLVKPTKNMRKKLHSERDEILGQALYTHLSNLDDLVVIADEAHVYHEQAEKFSASLRELGPLALIGLSATPSEADKRHVIFRYTLAEAIADKYVKIPVIAYRSDGYDIKTTAGQNAQLLDACTLLRYKEAAYKLYRDTNRDGPQTKPLLFVVAKDITHAKTVGDFLASTSDAIGSGDQVLIVDSESSDEALRLLDEVDQTSSGIRAVVSVNKLREGWDVKRVAVICAIRAMASEQLTEQILGRGLRLPFGKRTGQIALDTVDVMAHESYNALFKQKDLIRRQLQLDLVDAEPGTFDPTPSLAKEPTDAENGQNASDTSALPGESKLVTETSGPDLGVWGGPTLFDDGSAADFSEADVDPKLREESNPSDPALQAGHFRNGESAMPTGTRNLDVSPAPRAAYRVDFSEGADAILFPMWVPRSVPMPFQLSEIPLTDARLKGANFASSAQAESIRRRKYETTRDKDDKLVLQEEDLNSTLKAWSDLFSLLEVRESLALAVMSLGLFPVKKRNKNLSLGLVDAFLEGAGLDPKDAASSWTDEQRRGAISALHSLIAAVIATRRSSIQLEFEVKKIPIPGRLVESDVLSKEDAYVRREWYKGWKNSVLTAARFDSGDTEFALAHLFDGSAEVRHWLRLDPETDGIFIYRENANNYYPDFIVIDSEGTFWVVEGKSDKEATTQDVLDKRRVTEQWAREATAEGDFGKWRYLFCTTSNVKSAQGNWGRLVAASNPD